MLKKLHMELKETINRENLSQVVTGNFAIVSNEN
jgi:hypothetical protein